MASDGPERKADHFSVLLTTAVAVFCLFAGAFLNAWLSQRAERRRDLEEDILAQFRYFEAGEPDQAVITFVESSRSLVQQSPTYIEAWADIQRRIPAGCSTMEVRPPNPEGCFQAMVDGIQLMRAEFGSGEVSREDIETLLRPRLQSVLEYSLEPVEPDGSP